MGIKPQSSQNATSNRQSLILSITTTAHVWNQLIIKKLKMEKYSFLKYSDYDKLYYD